MRLLTALLLLSSLLFSEEVLRNLSVDEALKIVKKDNLEIKAAGFEEQMQKFSVKEVEGKNYGKLDFSVLGLYTNNPLTSFGMKLSAREATFRDLGFSDFLSGVGNAMQMSEGDFGKFSQIMGNPQVQASFLDKKPTDLNEPDDGDYYQTKLTYQIPLYTGGMLTEYKNVMQKMYELSKVDKRKLLLQKEFEVRKSFSDLSLLLFFHDHLMIIDKNMAQLEKTVETMIKEGYAKKIDLLEVNAKRANVKRMINQTKANEDLVKHFLTFLLNKRVESIKRIKLEAVMPTISSNDIVKKNLDIKKAEMGLAITEHMIKLKNAPYMPMVGAFGEYSFTDDGYDLGEIGDHDSYTLGMQVSWNIFNGGSDKSALEKAKVHNLKLKTQVKLAKKGIALKVDKIKTEIDNFDYKIQSLKEELKLSKAIYDNYLGRYKEKLVSINDVIIKQSLHIENLLKLQQAINARNAKIYEYMILADEELQ